MDLERFNSRMNLRACEKGPRPSNSHSLDCGYEFHWRNVIDSRFEETVVLNVPRFRSAKNRPDAGKRGAVHSKITITAGYPLEKLPILIENVL